MNLLIAFLILLIVFLVGRLTIIRIIKPIKTRILYPEKQIIDYIKSNNYEFIKKEFSNKDFNDFGINFDFWDKFIYTYYFYKIHVRDNNIKKEIIIYVVFMRSGAVFVKDKIFFNKTEII